MVKVVQVHPRHPEPEVIREAARILRRGGLVAFPTETVYGLGADALNPEAVARIFQVKGRPKYDPLIVHVASPEDMTHIVAQIPPKALHLARRFMPGPLTLVLPKAPHVPDIVTAGRPTVAVRVPAHPVALALLRKAGCPVAAPSANRFGHTSPTRAEHVVADLGDAVDLILDAGPTPIGVESTVLDLTQDPPVILRPGGVPREALETVLGTVKMARSATERTAAPSPGMLPRHYAPEQSALWLFEGPREEALAWFLRTTHQLHGQGRQVGLLIPEEDLSALENHLPSDVRVEVLGPEATPEALAHRLFAALRNLEGRVDVILARDVPEHGLGLAVRDRLHRAADRVFPETTTEHRT